jgi:DNA-binding NarL/FixJ family response regulator
LLRLQRALGDLVISEICCPVSKEPEMSPDQGPITVVLATDSLLIGDGLAALLAETTDVKVVGRARQHSELVELVDDLAPEAVIISIRTLIITTMAMMEVARRLRADHPDLGIVVISDRANGFVIELLRGGASRLAYLLDERLPTIETVLNALREVCAGQTVLDPSIVDALVTRHEGVAIDDLSLRELDVLELIADGLSNRSIAGTLNLSIKAVEKHVTAIFRKLELADQTRVDRRVTAALTYQHAQTSPLLLRHQGPVEGRDAFRPRT